MCLSVIKMMKIKRVMLVNKIIKLIKSEVNNWHWFNVLISMRVRVFNEMQNAPLRLQVTKTAVWNKRTFILNYRVYLKYRLFSIENKFFPWMWVKRKPTKEKNEAFPQTCSSEELANRILGDYPR